jgi:hypothetical protein
VDRLLRTCGAFDVLFGRPARRLSPRRDICRVNPWRREAGRPPDRAGEQVHSGRQRQDCKAAWHQRATNIANAGRRGDRVGLTLLQRTREMNQVDARHEIIREWRSLPKEQRQTDEQAALFAMQIKDKYKFSSESADPYQTVKGWLLSYRSLTRGLE